MKLLDFILKGLIGAFVIWCMIIILYEPDLRTPCEQECHGKADICVEVCELKLEVEEVLN